MSTAARPGRTAAGRPSRAERQRVAAAERAEAARRADRRRTQRRWAVGGAAVLAVAATVTFVVVRGDGVEASAAPVVGGDLHTLAAIGDALYVGGHAPVAVSRDGGQR